ncbi:MAG TPA: preprotein translocase subunit SecG [Gemmatimonadaceae bacterium]
MFSKILIALLAIDSVLLVAAVLLQSGKGSGLAASFGGASSSADSIMGTRQAGNLLTKISWWTGGIFIGLAFVLSLTSSRRSAPRSVLDQTFTAPPAPVSTPATTPQGTSVLPVQPAAPATDSKTKSPAPDTKSKAPSPNPTKTP